MERTCYILLDADNIVYTDYDLGCPERLSKRRMVGNNRNSFKYTDAIIDTIFNECKNIVLLNPLHLCEFHTLAYEKLARLRQGSIKFEILKCRGYSEEYKYNEPATPLDDGIAEFEFLKEKALNRSRKQSRWAQAFLHSIYKIYDGHYEDKDYTEEGFIDYHRASYIIDRDRKRVNITAFQRFNVVEIKLIGNPASSVIDLFEQSGGLISPIYCDASKLSTYDDELSAEYSFIADKSLEADTINKMMGVHGTVYRIYGFDSRDLSRVNRNYTFKVPYYPEY